MKKKKYLPRYYKWMETGRLPDDGLCSCLHNDKKLRELLSPDNPESYEISAYWGWNGEVRTQEYRDAWLQDICYEFTPLRQNIVLLLACLNGEL